MAFFSLTALGPQNIYRHDAPNLVDSHRLTLTGTMNRRYARQHGQGTSTVYPTQFREREGTRNIWEESAQDTADISELLVLECLITKMTYFWEQEISLHFQILAWTQIQLRQEKRLFFHLCPQASVFCILNNLMKLQVLMQRTIPILFPKMSELFLALMPFCTSFPLVARLCTHL